MNRKSLSEIQKMAITLTGSSELIVLSYRDLSTVQFGNSLFQFPNFPTALTQQSTGRLNNFVQKYEIPPPHLITTMSSSSSSNHSNDTSSSLKRSNNWTAKLQQSNASPTTPSSEYVFPREKLKKKMNGKNAQRGTKRECRWRESVSIRDDEIEQHLAFFSFCGRDWKIHDADVFFSPLRCNKTSVTCVDSLFFRFVDPSKIPLVLVACGSYSPITYLHLRMFEMAYDYIADSNEFEILGGYFSPVSDAYAKPGLAHWHHRVSMCSLAVNGIHGHGCERTMVDSWEASQPDYIRTALVLDHFHEELNGGNEGGVALPDGSRRPIRIMLLAGGDLIQSFAVPNLWKEADLNHILGDFGCLIIERTGANVHDFLLTNDSLHAHRKNVFVVKQYIHNDISSTKIRLFVRRGMSVKYLLPDPVIEYIRRHGLYSLESTL